MNKYIEKSQHPDASYLNHEAYKSGCVLFKEGNFKKALSAFEEALEYWPKDAQAWMALGNCHDELNKPAVAEKCFHRALACCAEKDKYNVLFNQGNSLLDQNKYEAAISFYRNIPANNEVYAKAQKNLLLAKEFLESKM